MAVVYYVHVRYSPAAANDLVRTRSGSNSLSSRYGVTALRLASLMFSLSKVIRESRNWSTLAIITLLEFHERSFGILAAGANMTMTAAVTLTTAPGGLLKDFSSVRFALLSVFRASEAAFRAGSALARSASQSCCFLETSSLIFATFFSSSSAICFSLPTCVHVHVYCEVECQ